MSVLYIDYAIRSHHYLIIIFIFVRPRSKKWVFYSPLSLSGWLFFGVRLFSFVDCLFPMGSLHTDLRLTEVEWGRGLWLCVSFLGSLVYPIILFMFILYALGEGWLLRYDMI